jgi:hypothetical protein
MLETDEQAFEKQVGFGYFKKKSLIKFSTLFHEKIRNLGYKRNIVV